MQIAARSGEDLRLLEENEEVKTVRRRPATAGIRISRGHQVHPLSKEASDRPTLPFNGITINSSYRNFASITEPLYRVGKR